MSLNRSTLYYEPKGESEENLQLMRRLDEQFLKTPYYGSRQMVYHLKRRGSRVGRKRVRRLMAKMGLGGHLSKAADFTASPGESSVSVSSSRIGGHPARSGVVHGCHLHPDASGLFVPGGDHGLVQPLGFVLEAVEHAGAVLLLRSTRGKRSTGTIPPEIFNTDQGSQFTSTEFTGLLKGAGVRISMDGRGRWMDNVFIERLWRSLKYECVYLNAFETGSEARQGIGHWIDLYNSERPHSAHAGATPEEVYTGLKKHSERDLALRLAPSQNFPYWRQQELRSPP